MGNKRKITTNDTNPHEQRHKIKSLCAFRRNEFVWFVVNFHSFGFKIFESSIVSSMTKIQIVKRPAMPFHIISREANKSAILIVIFSSLYPKWRIIRLKTKPLAATDAICPETLALTACIRR